MEEARWITNELLLCVRIAEKKGQVNEKWKAIWYILQKMKGKITNDIAIRKTS
jgi:hypothetical protein